MKRQIRKEVSEAYLGGHSFHDEESVENSKRRHMLSLMSGDIKFFEKILAFKRSQELTFIPKSSLRNR